MNMKRISAVQGWLRSPNVGNTNNTRNVNTSGTLNNNNANNTNGLSPDYVNCSLKVSPKDRNQCNKRKELISCPIKRQTMNIDAGHFFECFRLCTIFYFMKQGGFRVDVKDSVCSFDSLYKAMHKCKKGVTWKDSVSRYCNNGLVSTLKLQRSLEEDTYKIDDYYKFVIHEPKLREIVSTKFKDRVFQRSLCDNYLYKEMTKSFIHDNGACQNGKGTDFSRNRLVYMLRKHYRKHGSEGYVLKCDFKNYFGSTPHSTIKKTLQKHIGDCWAMEKSFDVIDTYDNGDKKGVGLGSQITQLVQLLVLSNIDHHIKEKLGIKCYLRYMDDLVLIHKDKGKLQDCLKVITELSSNLGLTLNSRKTQIFKLSQGISFLGFKFHLSASGKVCALILKPNISKRKRKIKKHKDLVYEGKMTREKADESYASWKAHAEHGNSFKTIQRMDKYYTTIWEEHYVQKIDGNGATQERVC